MSAAPEVVCARCKGPVGGPIEVEKDEAGGRVIVSAWCHGASQKRFLPAEAIDFPIVMFLREPPPARRAWRAAQPPAEPRKVEVFPSAAPAAPQPGVRRLVLPPKEKP